MKVVDLETAAKTSSVAIFAFFHQRLTHNSRTKMKPEEAPKTGDFFSIAGEQEIEAKCGSLQQETGDLEASFIHFK